MVFFPNTTIELWGYSDTDQYDKHGELVGDYHLKCETEADFQPMSANDTLEQFGEILQDTYKIFLSPDIEVENTDIIVIGDNSYSIMGTPEDWNHFLNYKQLTVKKHRKKMKL